MNLQHPDAFACIRLKIQCPKGSPNTGPLPEVHLQPQAFAFFEKVAGDAKDLQRAHVSARYEDLYFKWGEFFVYFTLQANLVRTIGSEHIGTSRVDFDIRRIDSPRWGHCPLNHGTGLAIKELLERLCNIQFFGAHPSSFIPNNN